MSTTNKVITGGIVTVVVIGVALLLSPFIVIDAGEEGIVVRNGAVDHIIGAGLQGKAPLIDNVVVFDVRTQKEQTDATAASSDLQNVTASVAINYNVNPDTVGDMYKRIGTDYKNTIIDPAIQETVKGVTAKYTAEQLITQRSQVTTDIQTALVSRLQPNDIVVTGVSITNFAFSDQFNSAIEAKVTAQQNAEAAKNKLQQVQYEADQTVAKATADAKAIQIQAQAIEQQGGANYVQLQAVAKWDGHLPTQMIPGGTVPFIQLHQ